MTPDSELLRRYVQDGSEAAFTELVRRHVDLVYSAALRLVGGDRHLAQDVTQLVFVDLCRKARALAPRESLAGWLHTAARFSAAKTVRTERRRGVREREASRMSTGSPDSEPEPEWDEVSPVLDEAIGRLKARDREVILLRFFEGKDSKQIGLLFGLGENAANMRVRRALDRLRGILGRFGITSTVSALATVLVTHGSRAAPLDLAARVARLAISESAIPSSEISGLLARLWGFGKLRLALLTAAVVVPALSLILPPVARDGATREIEESHEAPSTLPTVSASSPTSRDPSEPDSVPGSGILNLRIVADEDGAPIPAMVLRYSFRRGAERVDETLHADATGACRVVIAPGTTSLELQTGAEGFADTRLHWNVERGETVPPDYTLRVVRGVPIGGRVVDPEGRPVADATVAFGHDYEAAWESWPEDHFFRYLETRTDSRGQWTIDRIAPDMLAHVVGRARHPDHQPSPGVTLGQDGDAERRLREGTHLLGLSPSVTVRGLVLDGEGRSIPGAQVLVGYLGDTGNREGKSRIDGTFELRGCAPGRNVLTAKASGFGAVTRDVECDASGAAFRIVLRRGMPLRFVVTDDCGRPLPGATVRVGPGRATVRGRQEPSPVRFSFEAVADVEGRVAWEDAPEGELQASASAPGYSVAAPVRLGPDGRERVLALQRALTLVGTVRDSTTGRLVPRFRIVCGWPEVDPRDGRVSPRWSRLDRHTIGFGGGAFRHEIVDAILRADTNPGYVFRFEAEGYSPFVSRVVADGETEVRFDVALHSDDGATDDGPVRGGRESGGARANAE